MTRRIIILAVSFAVLLGGYFAYVKLTEVGKPRTTGRRITNRNPSALVSLSTSLPAKPNAPAFGDGDKLSVQARDKYERLMYTLESPKWSRQTDDGSWALEQPVFTLYRGDMVVTIRGDKGKVFAEEIKGSVKINTGSLSGNVTVLIDRNGPSPLPLAQRPKDKVEIRMGDVTFDNNRLELTTPSEVTVRSEQADFEGVGLTMNINESPSELRRLRIENGRQITIRDEGKLLSTPGGNAAADRSVVPVLVAPSLAASVPVATAPAGPPVPVAPTDGQFVLEKVKSQSPQEMAEELESVLPQAQGSGKKVPPARNMYMVQLESPRNDLNIVSSGGSLENASRATLLFEWGGQPKDNSEVFEVPSASGLARPKPAPAGTRSPLATKPASAPASHPPTGNSAKPSDKPKETRITWSGPLEMRPVGYVSKPDKKKYEVMTEGENLTLADKQTIVTCRRAHFRQPGQIGKLIGGDKKVCITMMRPPEKSDDKAQISETIIAPLITFNRQSGTADLHGAGEISQPYRGGRDFSLDPTVEPGTSTTAQSGMEGKDDSIRWSKSVAVLFGEATTSSGTGTKIKQYIKEATFFGDVELSRSATGDNMTCKDYLHVIMGRTETGKNTLKTATAVRDVQAHYENNDISGDKLVMDFEAVVKNKGKISNRPATMKILGSACVITREVKQEEKPDPLNPGKKVRVPATVMSVARADWIDADARTLRADLHGSPASIEQDQKIIKGNLIKIQARETSPATLGGKKKRDLLWAMVDGPGEAQFPMDRDPLSNTAFSQPRNATIKWTKFLRYSGQSNDADVQGGVELTSELDRMLCQSVHLTFDPTAGTEKASGGAGLATEIGTLGTRRLATIEAKGGVDVFSRSVDANGNAENLLQLNSPNFSYDAAKKVMLIDGEGTMLVGDLRQPLIKKKAVQPAAGQEVLPGVSQDLQTPSASVFVWKKMMKLTQVVSDKPGQDGRRIVQMSGDVVVMHRSGKQLTLTDDEKKRWNVVAWRDLPEGRNFALRCEDLEAQFDKPAEKIVAGTKAPSAQGPRVGHMRKFEALKDVNLKDGQWQVLGQRLSYSVTDLDGGGERDLAEIYGYQEGQRKTLAQIISLDPRTNRLQQQQAPRILWERFREAGTGKVTDKVTTSDVTAGGGR